MTPKTVEPSIIVREFDAPRELIFDAWTRVEHLNNWMFPMPGCQCEFVSADIKNGGTSLHKLTLPNGHQMWLLTQYEKVKAPDQLTFLQYMSNESGDIVPNVRMPGWPKDMLATLEFEALSASETKITFYWEPQNPTDEELAVFEASRADHHKGWGAGMDQLVAYLNTL